MEAVLAENLTHNPELADETSYGIPSVGDLFELPLRTGTT